jgi:hypothetical protein
MFRTSKLEASIEQLGTELLDAVGIKAVMMSKNEGGDVIITLVEGTEQSHKVKFGRVDRTTRTLSRHHMTPPRLPGNSMREAAAG